MAENIEYISEYKNYDDLTNIHLDKHYVNYYGNLLKQCNYNNLYTCAFFCFGVMFHLGKGLKQNWEKAFKLYNLAIEKKETCYLSMHNLAELYRDGNGVTKDITIAIKLYQKCITRESKLYDNLCSINKSYLNLADIYLHENNVRDLDMAKKYIEYNIAKFPNDMSLVYDLAIQCYNDKQYNDAFKYHKLCASKGCFSSMGSLICMYIEGKGVTCDMEEAERLVNILLDNDFVRGSNYYIMLLYKQTKYNECIEYYEKNKHTLLPEFIKFIAFSYYNLGNIENAIKYCELGISKDNCTECMHRLAYIYCMNHNVKNMLMVCDLLFMSNNFDKINKFNNNSPVKKQSLERQNIINSSLYNFLIQDLHKLIVEYVGVIIK